MNYVQLLAARNCVIDRAIELLAGSYFILHADFVSEDIFAHVTHLSALASDGRCAVQAIESEASEGISFGLVMPKLFHWAELYKTVIVWDDVLFQRLDPSAWDLGFKRGVRWPQGTQFVSLQGLYGEFLMDYHHLKKDGQGGYYRKWGLATAARREQTLYNARSTFSACQVMRSMLGGMAKAEKRIV